MKLAYLARRAAAFMAALLLLALSVGHADAATCPLAKAGTKYKVRIDSAPPGATVYIDNEQCGAVGVTPWAGSLVNGDYTIILKLDGYDLKQEAFKVVRSRKEQAKFIPLIKKQDPPRIDIRADADKNLFGAQVFLDGQLQGTAPLMLTTEPGRHLIEIKKEGFEPYQQWVETKLNNNESLAPTIKEIAKPKLGTIVVEADVRDAEVWIDGNKLPNTTPTVIPNVVEGLHVIEVRKDPAIPWKQTVQVVADQQVKVSAGLKATLGGQGGSIQVLSNISGAHVFLDGTDMGRSRSTSRTPSPASTSSRSRRPATRTARRRSPSTPARPRSSSSISTRSRPRTSARSRSCRRSPTPTSSSTAASSARCHRRRASPPASTS